MIGVISKKPVLAMPYIEALATQANAGQESPHGDGYGAAIFAGSGWLHLREQSAIWESNLNAFHNVRGQIMLLHARKASDPATVNLGKLHPFYASTGSDGPGLMFCQNGTIRDHYRLDTPPHPGAIDTEKYLAIVQKNYLKSLDIADSILRATSEIEMMNAQPTSLNALASNGSVLVAYKGRIQPENINYHTLFAYEDDEHAVISTEPFSLMNCNLNWEPVEGIWQRTL
jgi:predicted glutamine amidotransferase